MGSFLDVRREIAAATARNLALLGPSKRPRSEETTKEKQTVIAWGPTATKFHTKSVALTNCVEEMLEWICTAEKEKEEHKDVEECYKRRITVAVQGARE